MSSKSVFFRQRGEIATTLAIFSVMIVTLGLALGSNLIRQGAPSSTNAQSSAYQLDPIEGNMFSITDLEQPAPASLWDYFIRGHMCFNVIPPLNAKYKIQLVAEAENGQEEKVIGFSSHALTVPFQSRCGRRGEEIRMVFNMPEANPCPNVRIEFAPYGRGSIGNAEWARSPIVFGHIKRSFFPGCSDTPTNTPAQATPTPTVDPNNPVTPSETPTPTSGNGAPVTPAPTTQPIPPRAYSCSLDGGQLRGAIDIVGNIPTDTAGRPLYLKVAACVVLNDGSVRCSSAPDNQGRVGGTFAENTVQVTRFYKVIKPMYVLRGLPLNTKYGVFVYPELFDRNGNVALDRDGNPIRMVPYNAQAIDCRATAGSIRKEYDSFSQAVCQITFVDPQNAPQCRTRQDFRVTFAGGIRPVPITPFGTVTIPTGVPTVAVPTAVPTIAFPTEIPTVANKKLTVRVNVDGTLRSDYDRFTYWVDVCSENGCTSTPPADKTSGVIDVPGDRNGLITHRQDHTFNNAYEVNKVTLFYKYRRNDGKYNTTAVEIVHNNNTKCTDELFAPGMNTCKFTVSGNEGTLIYNVKLPDPQLRTYELAYGVENNGTYPITQTLIPYCSVALDNNGKSIDNTANSRLPADEKICSAGVAQAAGSSIPNRANLNFSKRAGISPTFLSPAFWEFRVCPGEAGINNRATANETQICTRNILFDRNEEIRNYFQSPNFANFNEGQTMTCRFTYGDVPANPTFDSANKAITCNVVNGVPPIGGPSEAPSGAPTAVPTIAVPTGTVPTAVPTIAFPTPPLDQIACIFTSKAKLEVCDETDPSKDPNCQKSSALPLADADIALWGILNSKQLAVTPRPEPGRFKFISKTDEKTGITTKETSSEYFEEFVAPGKKAELGCYADAAEMAAASSIKATSLSGIYHPNIASSIGGKLTRAELGITVPQGGKLKLTIYDKSVNGKEKGVPLAQVESTNGVFTFNPPMRFIYLKAFDVDIDYIGGGQMEAKSAQGKKCRISSLIDNPLDPETFFVVDKNSANKIPLYFKFTIEDGGVYTGENVSVDLINPNTYQVVSKFCKGIDLSSNVLSESDCVASQGDSLNRVSGISLACNKKYEYGWKLRKCFADGARVRNEGCGPFSAQVTLSSNNTLKGQSFVPKQKGTINRVYTPGVLSQDGRVSLTVFKMKDNTTPEAVLGSTAIYDRATETFSFGNNGVDVEEGQLYAIVMRVVSGSYKWNYADSATCYANPLGTSLTVTDNGNNNFAFVADQLDFNFRVDVDPVNLCKQQTALIQAILKSSDVNKDGIVNLADMEELIADLNKEGTGLAADLDGSGRVDAVDFTLLLGNLYKETASTAN